MKDPVLGRDVLRAVIGAVRRGERRGRPGVGAGSRAVGTLPSGSTFIRGLSIGALVGAAIAGSAIWERRHRRRGAAAIDAGEAPGAGS